MSNPGTLSDQVAVVTGATSGMGEVMAVELARRGAQVVTIARNPQRADDLERQVVQIVGPGCLTVVTGDLASRDALREAAAQIMERHPVIHVLINNAGAHYPDRRLSPDGIELHITVDYLAGFGLTSLLMPALTRGRARVVHVASNALNDVRPVPLVGRPRPVTLDLAHLEDLRLLNPEVGYNPFEAYARAKLLTVMAGYHLARLVAPDGVTVNAVHPGIVATPLIDDLVPKLLTPFRGVIRRTMLTPEAGAQAALRLATDPQLATTTGAYFNRAQPAATPAVSYDVTAQARLWAVSAEYFGLDAIPVG